MDLTPADPEQIARELLEHGDVLLRYAMARVGDRGTAEDLVQDTLVTAVGKHSEFAGRSSTRTWLVGILRHKILDHYRWRRRHPADQPNPAEERDAQDPWFTPLGVWREDPNVGLEQLDGDPERSLERSRLRAALQRCIDLLPESLHRIFVLRELEGLEPDETCETAGISRHSLAVFLYRARQALRACLQHTWSAS